MENFPEFVYSAMAIWVSGGWLMVPLLLLTLFIYFTTIKLMIELRFHFLATDKVYRLDDERLGERMDKQSCVSVQLLQPQLASPKEVKRHFELARKEYLPPIDRRIRYLGTIITAGPLIGLLGTVTGMLSTFQGLMSAQQSKFENVVEGISEALVTTQTGLIIAIPAMVLLSYIIHRRHTILRALARLESFNTRLVMGQNGSSL